MNSHHLVEEELPASDGERGPDPGGGQRSPNLLEDSGEFYMGTHFLLVDQLACRTHNPQLLSCYWEQVEPRRSLWVSRGSQSSVNGPENLFC